MITLLAPGQGAQTPRMLAPWLKDPERHRLVENWSQRADIDLIALGTTASKDEIARTENAQPLLVTAALLAGLPVIDALADAGQAHAAVAGHSVGELAAAALAGALAPADAVHLAAVRGRAMAAACATTHGSMAAVLGGNLEHVTAAIESAGLTVANHNGPGQLVAAGPIQAIEVFVAAPPAGTAVRRLQVAGAFHSAAMQSATDIFAEAISSVAMLDAEVPIVCNADGAFVRSATSLCERLVGQITAPVRWDLCLETFRAADITTAICLPPADTLAGIASRTLPSVNVLRITSPRDIDRLSSKTKGRSDAAA
ncbi:ACP S-malonyltransferase [Rhodococcoides yunnanense]|uniref:[acyl-carrier-protein] S-malonyltransferase n=1 Tax=Rhodococcoides yunnanense TaxID=278209 RepID=A0ABU4B9D0_9NOCA|nr:ACP S-malonyltransferase [Rhodococcus yunnanensis]MDV6260754.1 ACP S-malonyltransferase [Rhodococcus yunnanensis]